MTAVGPVVRARPAAARLPLWAGALAAALLLGAAGGVLAHVLSSRGSAPALPLPDLHGQVSWAAGERPAPVFRLRDGSLSAALRGRPVVVAFEPARCGAACASLRRTLGALVGSLAPAARPAVVTVGGSGPRSAAAPATVRRSFGVPDRAVLVYLLDRRGFERTGYLFPFAPAFVLGDLRKLASERP